MDAILRLVLDTQALLRQLSDVVREWTASTSRMNRAAEGVDFDLAQREAKELEEIVRQMAAGVVGNLAKVEAAAAKAGTQGLGRTARESKAAEVAIARLTSTAEREFGKIQRAASRVQIDRLRKEAAEAHAQVARLGRAEKEIAKLEKAADRIQFRRAKEEARAVEQAIRTLEQSGARSFRSLEQRAEAAGIRLQAGIGGALTRLPPQVQALQRRFETALASMRTAADRVTFEKAQREAQRLEAAIHRMGLSAQRDLDRIRQSAAGAGQGFSLFGVQVGTLTRALGALGIFLSARILAQWAGDAINAAIRLEAFNAQLKASTSNLEEANDLFAFANEQTERLGLNFASVVEGTARFAAATKNTNLTLAERKDILLSVFEASRVLNLSEQRLQNTLLALEQIASKATVSMEELRRQLGDNIPGAVAILAKQMGVTQERLLRMIETNQVLSEEALPLLAKGFRETFGPGVKDSIDTFAASLGRLQKSIFDAKVAFGTGFTDVVKADVDRAKETFSDLEIVFRVLGITTGLLVKALSGVFQVITLGASGAGQAAGALVNELTGMADSQVIIERTAGEIRKLGFLLQTAFDEAHFGDLDRGLTALTQGFALAASAGDLFGDEVEQLQRAADALVDRYERVGKEVPEALSIIVNALEAGTDGARKFAADVIQAIEAVKLGNLTQATKDLSDAWNRAVEDGSVSKDQMEDFAEAVRLLLKATRDAGDEIPAILKVIAVQAGISLQDFETAVDQVARALEEAAERSKKVKDEFFGTEKAAEALANKLLDVVHGLDLSNLTAEQAAKIRDLIADVAEAFELLGREVPPNIAEIAKQLDALGFGLLGVRDEVQKLTDDLREALSEVDLDELVNVDPDGVGAQRLENLRDKVQEVLDAWDEYGEEVPADIQAVADKLGVTTTVVEKELEKQEKAAKKAAKEDEQAAKRRIDALERIAATFRKLTETLRGDGESEEIAALEAQLDELEDRRFNFTGSLEELDELDAEIAALETHLSTLRDEQVATGESAREMASEIDDAIRGLVEQLEPVFADLATSQQLAIESILTNLQALGQDGVATGDDVSVALQQMISVLDAAGQPTADLRSALREIETGSLDVGAAFDALEEKLKRSNEEFSANAETLKESNAQLKKDVDAHIRELGRLENAHESVFNRMAERQQTVLTYWQQINAECEKHKDCLGG